MNRSVCFLNIYLVLLLVLTISQITWSSWQPHEVETTAIPNFTDEEQTLWQKQVNSFPPGLTSSDEGAEVQPEPQPLAPMPFVIATLPHWVHSGRQLLYLPSSHIFALVKSLSWGISSADRMKYNCALFFNVALSPSDVCSASTLLIALRTSNLETQAPHKIQWWTSTCWFLDTLQILTSFCSLQTASCVGFIHLLIHLALHLGSSFSPHLICHWCHSFTLLSYMESWPGHSSASGSCSTAHTAEGPMLPEGPRLLRHPKHLLYP